jgi:N6-L-threonylcarbamoyladenine synthase
MNILGFETSCDETSVSIVKNGKDILSNVTATSLKEHSRYGGVIPEIASRHHLECINTLTEKSLSEANLSLKKIGAIAVTKKPGLIGSLLVGISFAQSLSYTLNKPLIEIDHIKAHLYAAFLRNKKNNTGPNLPAIGLIVSGGHTSLYHMKTFKHFDLIGHTLDDAAGEAFDKVARILDLGYPGGPIIDSLAKKTPSNENIIFNCASLPGTFNFSFSGIKTAVLYHYQKHKNQKNFSVNQTIKAFQNSVISNLVKKSINACKKYKSKKLIIGGGVAANSQLRTDLTREGIKNDIQVFFPPLALCMDNAAMIAGLSYHRLKNT